MSRKFSRLYNAEHLQRVARETGFVVRKGKLSPSMFLDTLLFHDLDSSQVSLTDHSVELQLKHRLQIRKQSIDGRFHAGSVKFIQALLAEHLEQQLTQTISTEALQRFSTVQIKDSTRFQLPAHLKDAYPGNGGKACEAGVHVQFEFDLKSGRVSDVKATNALRPDQQDAIETLSDIMPGSLVLRDLGYFSTHTLQHIIESKAYFISRLMPKVNLYEQREQGYENIDIEKLYRRMNRYGLHTLEQEVLVGKQLKVPVRLFIERLPHDQINKRIGRAKRRAQKKGSTLNKSYKVYSSLNLFITNVPPEWLPGQQVRTLYRLRWQIELRFKCWKSLCRLHAIKKMKLHRFETYLFGCLLHILLNWEIAINLIAISWKCASRLLSIYKCYKALRQSGYLFREAFFNPLKLHSYIDRLSSSMCQLVLEKRKGHLSQEEILLLKLEQQPANIVPLRPERSYIKNAGRNKHKKTSPGNKKTNAI